MKTRAEYSPFISFSLDRLERIRAKITPSTLQRLGIELYVSSFVFPPPFGVGKNNCLKRSSFPLSPLFRSGKKTRDATLCPLVFCPSLHTVRSVFRGSLLSPFLNLFNASALLWLELGKKVTVPLTLRDCSSRRASSINNCLRFALARIMNSLCYKQGSFPPSFLGLSSPPLRSTAYAPPHFLLVPRRWGWFSISVVSAICDRCFAVLCFASLLLVRFFPFPRSSGKKTPHQKRGGIAFRLIVFSYLCNS